MKKIFTLSISLLFFSSAFSQLNSGFYRVKNADTQRYVYVYDDQGEAKPDGLQVIADLDAIYLRADLSNAISDPGSVIYVNKVGGSYDLEAQGTSVYSILGRYVSLSERNGYYSVGATISGVSAYLADSKGSSTTGYGKISIDANGKRLWDAVPLDSSTDNYFGVQPSLESNGFYYTTLFTSFGYSFASTSTKAYIVDAISDKGAVLVKEVVGDIPNATPVIIESNSSSVSDNRLNVKQVSSSLSSNKLVGVYFNTDNSEKTFAAKVHINQTPVDQTMRFLSTTSDGKLAFTKSSMVNVPANTAYLKVDASTPDNLVVCFTKEEFENYSNSEPDIDPTPGPGVDPTPGPGVDPAPGPGVDPTPGPGVDPTPDSLDEITKDMTNKSIYNLLGRKVENAGKLPAGIYIIDGKKTVIR